MTGDERCPFPRPLLRTLDAALPLQHRPPAETGLRQQREHPFEVHLAIAQRAEPAGPAAPGLVPAVHPDPARGAKLRVLDVKGPDPLPVQLNKRQVVQLLQQKVARVVVQTGRRVVVHPVEEHLVGRPVVQVRARVEFIGERQTAVPGPVEQRPPAPAQLRKRLLDDPLGALRPRVRHVPGESPGQHRDIVEPHLRRRPDRLFQLLRGPGRARLALQVRGVERREHHLVRRVHGQHLALQVGR